MNVSCGVDIQGCQMNKNRLTACKSYVSQTSAWLGK